MDWLVIAGYAVGMLAVGQYYARRNKTTGDYMLGGRRMSPFAAGSSLFAALASAATAVCIAYAGTLGLRPFSIVWIVPGSFAAGAVSGSLTSLLPICCHSRKATDRKPSKSTEGLP